MGHRRHAVQHAKPEPNHSKHHQHSKQHQQKRQQQELLQVNTSLWLFPNLSHCTHIGILLAAALLCFSNNLTGDFVFDDNEALINNKDVTSDGPLWKLLQHDFWGSNISSNTSHKSYRPLTVLTFRWNHMLAGGLHSTGFHAVNIGLHAAVCALLYQVLLQLFSEVNTSGSAAFLCSLVFTVHPVHAECVSGVVGRAELLCALFSLLSLHVYIRACHTGSGRAAVAVCVSCALCVISVLCKEQGITVLGLCSAYDVLLYNKLHPLKILGDLPNLFKSESWRRMMWRHLALLVTGLVTLTLRWKVMGSEPPMFHEVDNPHSFVNGTVLRVLNYNYLYAINAWLCVCPQWLCFDWSMGCVPVVTSLIDVRLVAVLVLWAWLAAVLYWCLVEPTTPCKSDLTQIPCSWMTCFRLVLMALATVIIPFLPASNLLFRVGFVVAERVLYMPSVGVCMLLTLSLLHAASLSPHLDKVCSVSVIVLVCLYSARSLHRSTEWGTERRLFESAQAVCPLNAKVHYNIAKVHADAGNTDYALEKYRLAVQLNPTYDQAMNNLANVLKERGEYVEAEILLERAVSIRADFAAAWMNLGIVQATLGKIQASETSYLTALRHRARYPDCFYNLGNLYLDEKRHADALTAWRNATLQKPSHVSAWLNMIILLDNLERHADLALVAEEALHYNPGEPSLHYNFANALGKAGRNAQSEKHFLTAIKLSPNQASYHANLGVLYHRWGRLAEAEGAYTRALELNPADSVTQGYRQSVRSKRQAGG